MENKNFRRKQNIFKGKQKFQKKTKIYIFKGKRKFQKEAKNFGKKPK